MNSVWQEKCFISLLGNGVFPVQKSRGEVGKWPHLMSSDTGIGKNTVVGGE